MIYPILTMIWLLMAVLVFWYQFANPNPRFFIPHTSISFAWVAVLFVIFNLMRWYSHSVARRVRKEKDDALRRHFMKRAKEVTPDPLFQFDDAPDAEHIKKKEQ